MTRLLDDRTRWVFAAMVREEWRMHNRLFAGRRFAAFPVLIAVLSTGATSLLLATGQDPGAVYAGMHALAFVFGLHTGSIGLVGRDAIRNLVGEMTLLIFSGRTLPLSRRRLFGVFLAKDVLYYALLFMLPMAVGGAPLALGGGSITPFVLGSAVATVLLLWATLSATFALGIGTTITGLSLESRGLAGRLAVAAIAVGLALAWLDGYDLAALTPYGVFQSPTLPRVWGAAALLVGVFVAGGLAFDLSDRRRVRHRDPLLRQWVGRVGDPVATKTLLDVHRSSGGFGKVVFSGAILLGVTAALVDLAAGITGVSPSNGISFGAILGLTGFTTYNWLTQFDDIQGYSHHPIAVADVFRAKFRAFLLLGPVVGLAFYALALGLWGARLPEAVVGAVLLVGVATYIFGVTVFLTGLSPNEFLFDTVLFAAFGFAVMVPLVPVLIVGFALSPVSPPLLGALGGGGALLGLIGVFLYRRSLPRWTEHHLS
jgi:hypothetical protein